MKRILINFLIISLFNACVKLDLNPLAEPASGNFYSNQVELELAVNDLYRGDFWFNDNEFFSDNSWNRSALGNSVTFGTINADDGEALRYWTVSYKAIARVNTFLAHKDRAASNTTPAVMTRLEAEARLIRAQQYACLISKFGDVPFLTQPIELSQAYGIKRTGKDTILNFIYEDLDFAAANLPSSYSGSQVRRFTKGCAYAVKARIALYMNDWQKAKDAASEIMKLADAGIYALHAKYRDLFLKSGETSKEIIISIPRDEALNAVSGASYVQDFISRNAGGYGARIPTREIVDAYECTDGLPIDESPLYNPRKPFANRDPRLTDNVVEFGTMWLRYSYQPHPDSLTVYSSKTNTRVRNNDTRAIANFASFTGFLWKKGIDETWADRLKEDNDNILYRYAEALLTYAEAKVELGEADASVLRAINLVRARAYRVNVNQTSSYPAITTTNISQLRKIIRRERRVEFPLEGLRYMDLIRWKIAEKALTRPVIGLPDPAKQDRSKWLFPGITPIDEDGIADYSVFGSDVKQLANRNFDKERQYLWPIPNVDRIQNPSLVQNPGY